MISIKKDGQPFDLGNIQMTFRLRSPLWNDIPSHTFSFELDATDRNLKLTGYLHRPTTRQTQPTDIPVQCNIHGWILGATLRVETATEKKIKCHLAIDNGQLNVDWGNKYLDEMDFPNITRNGGVYEVMVYNKDKTSDEVACQFPPVKIPEYFGEEEPDDAYKYTGWINYYDAETPEYLTPYIHNGTGKVWTPSVSVPMFYLRWILKQIMLLNGIRMDPRFMSTGPLKEMLVFNNRCCEEKRRRDYFRATKTTQQTFDDNQTIIFDDETTPPNADDNNCYNNTTGVITVKNYGIHEIVANINILSAEGQYNLLIIDGYNHELHTGENIIRWTHFFSFNEVGYTYPVKIYSYDLFGEEEVPKQITVSAGSYLSGRNASLSDKASLYFDSYINSRLHMPHVKVKEFFTWLKDGFGMTGLFDAAGQQMRFVLMDDVLKKPATRSLGNLEAETEYSPDTLNGMAYQFEISGDDAPVTDDITGMEFLGNFATGYDLPLAENSGYYAYVYTVGKYYVYSWNDTTSRYEWQAKTDYLKPLTTGEGEMEVKPAWHPPVNFYEGDIFGSTPMVKCKGSSPYFKVGVNTPPLIMMLYYGMQKGELTDGTTPYSFPMASGLRYNTQGEEIGQLELKWDGEKGLRETYWKALEEFYASRWGLKGKKQIDAVWLRQLSWEEGYLHKGREYLLDTAEFTVTQLGFSAATVTAWRKP